MFVAKKFKWEAAHRIPWHPGKCQNLHGHSYKMDVEFEGDVDSNGIVIDFNDIKALIDPYVELFDHSTIISKNDHELLEVFKQKSWKHHVLDFDSTAENFCIFFSNIIAGENAEFLQKNGIRRVGIRVFETDTAYAYKLTDLKNHKAI